MLFHHAWENNCDAFQSICTQEYLTHVRIFMPFDNFLLENICLQFLMFAGVFVVPSSFYSWVKIYPTTFFFTWENTFNACESIYVSVKEFLDFDLLAEFIAIISL